MKFTSAFVLGAGLGTRLKSLTQRLPKPLIPVANQPLITRAFDHLIDAGVERLVVNTHWRAEAYDAAFPERTHRGVPIAFRHEWPEVLETGGGIKNVEDLLSGGPFIVYNGDILADLPLEPAIRAHHGRGDEVTLILRSSGGPLQVALDRATGRVTDIGNRIAADSRSEFLFTGIYLVQPRFFARLVAGEKVSVVRAFVEMIRTGAPLGGIVIDDGQWWDLGTREQYLAVHAALAARGGAPWVHSSAQVAASARILEASAIGAGARIGAGAEVRDSIIWPGAEIADGSFLNQCIVTAASPVSGTHSAADL